MNGRATSKRLTIEERIAGLLRPALNEWEQHGQKYQRFSSGGEDTATAMARYIVRNIQDIADLDGRQ